MRTTTDIGQSAPQSAPTGQRPASGHQDVEREDGPRGESASPSLSSPSLPLPLPTAPCSVVWSRGHAYVLELIVNRPRWVGVDDRGRPVEYTCADLQRRGWSRSAH